ncbi:hypothetical protein [Desulfosporosinus hippei]|uniref:hypothetical protein n=1 Tax=Desulfosporosinus hippei TaxID=569859 RepID=UPI000B836579|nr:hypothetical protein [Desulfosporosinus hippei]
MIRFANLAKSLNSRVYEQCLSELAQLKLNIGASVGILPPPKWKSEHSLIEGGVSELITMRLKKTAFGVKNLKIKWCIDAPFGLSSPTGE